MTKLSEDDLKPFKIFGLSTLQLMAIIAMLGVVLTLVACYLF